MKIISWNCNGKFREKYKYILEENADIYVIQECENPLNYLKEFKGFYSKYKWYGENNNKGLAIFVKDNIHIQTNEWPYYCLRHFISVKINNKFDLVGVWASPPHIEEYFIYQAININNYSENTIIIGDFNSNAIWDKKHQRRNHTAVVNELQNINIVSAYHYFMKEQSGKETQPTFYLYRHYDKPYHIDYCFGNPKHFKSFDILEYKKWIQFSDHLPIKIEIK
ncbi:MAG: endonuclease/exonuclease/phosphatase family protein [Clostridia bacterium]|nr:endonuclease/exonuclease/phosphatase family protein [Clostridia bacterium]